MQMVNVNFNALFDVTRAVLPSMIERQSGHIVVIGSISGRSAYPGGSCYAATKHAVMAFTECLMLEVRDFGVKVSVVNPGSVATHFSERSDASWMLAADDVANAVRAVVQTPPNVLIHRVEVRTLTVPKKH
jgi:NADP-dependent 3-hydroxy acid dehydrogenase YdfG